MRLQRSLGGRAAVCSGHRPPISSYRRLQHAFAQPILSAPRRLARGRSERKCRVGPARTVTLARRGPLHLAIRPAPRDALQCHAPRDPRKIADRRYNRGHTESNTPSHPSSRAARRRSRRSLDLPVGCSAGRLLVPALASRSLRSIARDSISRLTARTRLPSQLHLSPTIAARSGPSSPHRHPTRWRREVANCRTFAAHRYLASCGGSRRIARFWGVPSFRQTPKTAVDVSGDRAREVRLFRVHQSPFDAGAIPCAGACTRRFVASRTLFRYRYLNTRCCCPRRLGEREGTVTNSDAAFHRALGRPAPVKRPRLVDSGGLFPPSVSGLATPAPARVSPMRPLAISTII